MGVALSGCASLSQSPAPVVQGGQTRPAPVATAPYAPPPGVVVTPAPISMQDAPPPAAGEVSAYRAKAPVMISNASGATHIPTYPMASAPASAPALAPVRQPVSYAPPPRDPDDDRPDTYKVKAGDTLYSIALNYGQDYRDLAVWNQLDDPGVIKVDQVLRLTPPAEPAPARAPAPVAAAADKAPQPTPPVADAGLRRGPKAVKLPYTAEAARKIGPLAEAPPAPAPAEKPAEKTEKPAAPAEKTEKLAKADKAAAKPDGKPDSKVEAKSVEKDKPTKDRDNGKPAEPVKPAAKDKEAAAPAAESTNSAVGDEEVASWGWPAQGKVINRFTDSNKGIDIGGKTGQPVFASAKGKVVYSGAGLRGYGKLIIIKHNKTYLTAYAHNSQLLVKEGQAVNKGQKIAEMGNTDADQVKLHFEIRRFGKPVDPQKHLGNAP